MSENWERWENEVVNGTFPLRRSVRNSGHSAVFLTEHKSHAIGEALLKLVPALPTLREAQLSQWSVAARLSHPCLVRLLDSGSCRLGGLNFLYVVTEYAEQTLAQILAQRALEIEEFRKLVRPVLEGLSFLHRKQLVHGGLKPSNLLLFKERLKLASDAVRPVGESSASIAPPSVFDPPESRDGSFSAAGDVWSLGVLIVEALTQKQPVWPDKEGAPVLPKSLPASFVGLVLRCLNRNPARRPTVEELDAEINPMPAYVTSSVYVERSLQPAFGFASGPVVNELPVVTDPPVVFPRHEVNVSPGRREPAVGVISIASAAAGPAADAPGRAPGVDMGANPFAPGADTSANRRASASTAPHSAAVAASIRPVGTPQLAGTSLRPPGDANHAAANDPIVDPILDSTAVLPRPPRRGLFITRAAMIVTGVLAAGWGGAVFLSYQAHAPAMPIATAAASPIATPTPAAQVSLAQAQAQPQPPAVVDPRAAIHEELPDVPEKALATIHGRMIFAVRVTVDPEGRIVHAIAVGNRSSKYFARLCTEAAMHWKFAPAETIATRKWLLHFEFTRKGIVTNAI